MQGDKTDSCGTTKMFILQRVDYCTLTKTMNSLVGILKILKTDVGAISSFQGSLIFPNLSVFD